ncbi:hypothetical protein CEXT_775031, partial [Caerostris extrusa]
VNQNGTRVTWYWVSELEDQTNNGKIKSEEPTPKLDK